MGVDQLLSALGPGAAPALAVLVVLLWRRDLVFGWLYDEMRQDRDYWRNVAEHGLQAAEKSARAAEQIVSKVKGEG